MPFPFTPFLILILSGFAAFVLAIGYANLVTWLPSRKPNRQTMGSISRTQTKH
jgi:hypothetical protein